MKKFLIILMIMMIIGCSQKAVNDYDLVVEEYTTQEKMEIGEAQDMYNVFTNLDYDSLTCDGIVEYTFIFDNGDVFQVNLSDKWIWYNNKEATLNDDTILEIQALLN